MSDAAPPTLIENERAAREATRRDFGTEIELVTRLINAYLDGFRAVGDYTTQQDRDPRSLILALISRSFNSARCSFDLLLRAYYQQSIALTRMIDESFLATKEIMAGTNPSAFWDESIRPRKFSDMAGLPGEELRNWWDAVYGVESEISHPRTRSLAMALADDMVHLGPVYTERFARLSFWLLINATTRMLHVLTIVFATGLDEQLQIIDHDVQFWLQVMEHSTASEPPHQLTSGNPGCG